METDQRSRQTIENDKGLVPKVFHELTVDDVVNQTRKIQEVMSRVMKKNTHYGVIPGCDKPSLYKPGAEKLLLTFRLRPEFHTDLNAEDPNATIDWTRIVTDKKTGKKKEIQGTTKGYFEYKSLCTLVHIISNEIFVQDASGSCNNFEKRYRWANPNDIKNTVRKMSEKRSLVAAVLMALAVSDIFTQDIEDLKTGEEEGTPGFSEPYKTKPPPQSAPKPRFKGKPKGKDTPKTDLSWRPEFQAQMKIAREHLGTARYYALLKEYGFDTTLSIKDKDLANKILGRARQEIWQGGDKTDQPGPDPGT